LVATDSGRNSVGGNGVGVENQREDAVGTEMVEDGVILDIRGGEGTMEPEEGKFVNANG
jgi:hypothetical protein